MVARIVTDVPGRRSSGMVEIKVVDSLSVEASRSDGGAVVVVRVER